MTEKTLTKVREILRDRSRLQEMAETNYMLGWRFLSYEMLEEKLDGILTEIFGSCPIHLLVFSRPSSPPVATPV